MIVQRNQSSLVVAIRKPIQGSHNTEFIMPQKCTVAVVGASGFVGRAVVSRLDELGSNPVRIRAPRITYTPGTKLSEHLDESTVAIEELAQRLHGTDAVVNAAGDPDASSRNVPELAEANSVLPAIIATAAVEAGVKRYVHISSAVVQGRIPTLDASNYTEAFSDYAHSKAIGERTARKYGPQETVVYRPPSVHAEDRRITQMIARLGQSPLRSIAGKGNAPSPQALLANVADAVVHLALSENEPPGVVHHPWEGVTTSSLLRDLGGREPRRIPQRVARTIVGLIRIVSKSTPSLSANARRLEMVWFGQAQNESWLTTNGWKPRAGTSEWPMLGEKVRTEVS